MTPRRPISKWRFFALYWAVMAAVAFFLWPLLFLEFKIDEWVRLLRQPEYWLWFALTIALLAGAQAAFLLPVRAPRAAPGSKWSRRIRSALAGIGLGLCVAAVIAVLHEAVEAAGLNTPWNSDTVFLYVAPPLSLLGAAALMVLTRGPTPALVSLMVTGLAGSALLMGLAWAGASVIETVAGYRLPRSAWVLHPFLIMLTSWPFTSYMVYRFVRNRPPETALARLSHRLFLGTLIEAAAIIPFDVMVRRKSDCYCFEGTLWGLTICWGIGAFALGPAIWLIPLAKRRRRWHGSRCPVCEYDMSACMEAPRCPECGSGWKA